MSIVYSIKRYTDLYIDLSFCTTFKAY